MFTAWLEADFWPIAVTRLRPGTEPFTNTEPAPAVGLKAITTIGSIVTTIAIAAAAISIVEDTASSSSATIIITVAIKQLGDYCCRCRYCLEQPSVRLQPLRLVTGFAGHLPLGIGQFTSW